MKSSTETLIRALQILSVQVQSKDGVANAAILEAAQRMEEMDKHIERLEKAGDAMENEGWNEPHLAGAWRIAKKARP